MIMVEITTMEFPISTIFHHSHNLHNLHHGGGGGDRMWDDFLLVHYGIDVKGVMEEITLEVATQPHGINDVKVGNHYMVSHSTDVNSEKHNQVAPTPSPTPFAWCKLYRRTTSFQS